MCIKKTLLTTEYFNICSLTQALHLKEAQAPAPTAPHHISRLDLDGDPSHPDGDPSHPDGDPSHPDGDPSHPDGDPSHPHPPTTHSALRFPLIVNKRSCLISVVIN